MTSLAAEMHVNFDMSQEEVLMRALSNFKSYAAQTFDVNYEECGAQVYISRIIEKANRRTYFIVGMVYTLHAYGFRWVYC